MQRPSEWDIPERVRRAISGGRAPLELWADARDRADLETGLAVVAALLDHHATADATRVLDELEPLAAGPHRAVAVVLRQRLRVVTDQPVDVRVLADALDVLLGAARWQDVLDASSMLAQELAADRAAVRRYSIIAIGAAEAGGARFLGAARLRQLAAAELAAGGAVRCLAHLEHALRRLDGVLLLGARLEQGRCHELAGDAHASAGDLDAAREQYDRARERFDHRDFGGRHRERVTTKRATLG